MSIRDADDAVQAVLTKLEALGEDMLILEGEHELIPSTPAVAVYPLNTVREYVGAPRRVEAIITIEIMVYHSAIVTRAENQQAAADLVKTLMDALESSADFNGDALVLNTLVTRNEYGEAVKGRSKYFASRINLQLTSRYNIGVAYA